LINCLLFIFQDVQKAASGCSITNTRVAAPVPRRDSRKNGITRAVDKHNGRLAATIAQLPAGGGLQAELDGQLEHPDDLAN
jgi:hypothetical protein